MRPKLPFRTLNKTQILLFAIAIISVIWAGLSGLVYPSIYSPILFLGGLMAIGMLIAWLAKPVWALYMAIFLVFLPIGLIPANIHSLLNRSVTVIAAVAWLIRSLSTHKKMVWTGSVLFMLCFLAWSSITILWAQKIDPAANALQVYLLRFLVFLFLIPNEINTKHNLDGLMKTLALSGWILMLSVIGTLIQDGYTAGSRLKILGENENGVGTLALITMIGVVWQSSQPSKNYQVVKALMTAIFILLTSGLVAMSGSRGSAISFVVTLIAFLFWKPTRRWGKLGFLIVILAFIVTPSIFTTLVQRFTVEQDDTLLGGREVLWQAAWQMISDHPVLGVGVGNAPYAVLPYLETETRIIGRESVAIHNPILTVWSETAILGIIFYLGIIISAIYSFYKQNLKLGIVQSNSLILYFALVSSVTLGYSVSWFKGGGMQSAWSFFLLLGLLTLPSVWDIKSFDAVSQPIQIPGKIDRF